MLAVEQAAADVTTVRCRLDRSWRGHRPDSLPSSPSTPARAPIPSPSPAPITATASSLSRSRRSATTPARSDHACVGQPVQVEGPYGCFDIERRDPQARQVWIAGGIGVTPFLAWLESLQADPARAPSAELHYCTVTVSATPSCRASKRSARHCPASRLYVLAPVGDALQAAALGDVKNAGSGSADRPGSPKRCVPASREWAADPSIGSLPDALKLPRPGTGDRRYRSIHPKGPDDSTPTAASLWDLVLGGRPWPPSEHAHERMRRPAQPQLDTGEMADRRGTAQAMGKPHDHSGFADIKTPGTEGYAALAKNASSRVSNIVANCKA